MNTVMVVIAVILVLSGFVIRRYTNDAAPQAPEMTDVLSQSSDPTMTPTAAPSVTLIPPRPTVIPSAIPTAVPTAAKTGGRITDYIYPGATVRSQSEDSLSLESGDSPDKVTDWYEEKIRSAGMNVRSFVKTKTNGKVLNKLSAAGTDDVSISIEISREPGESAVRITVTL
ncbi:hypothetical protein A2Z33_00950 [Candidatus Gottesmanbacteria bacterium RBG_16_52_11]|uniref:Uncharacterized protein n=1 Tax=Candidatus Gottesmanbacteria bacterium RBG_16_52_11 TaxID=1798374 RepID=A0A1F5YNN3_9BACT|nr:MAG: hypothetical protein A2Z33_00950 [Candidatus Gottesmanbacteria bacterium RBG_16_52_11]